MKRIVMICMGVSIIYLLMFIEIVAAYQSIVGFTYPLRQWNIVCGFSIRCADDNHLGTDLRASAGTPVYAPYDGYVKEAQKHNGYGGTVIIEVYTDAEYVTIVIGHLRPTDLKARVGEIKQGDLLGYIGTRLENGGYGEHLHIGIRKGQYASYTYKCGSDDEWTYAGYTDCPAMVLPNWYNPEEFFIKTAINLRQSTPHAGKNIIDVLDSPDGSIGWYYPVASPITNEIDASGDDKGMSLNTYVQNYPGKACTINGTSQFCDGVIVYDALGGARSAHLVWYQQFGGYSGNGGWYKSGGPHSTGLRNPVTNSYWSPKDNCWRQDFQMGWLCYENIRSYDPGDVAPGVYDPWCKIFSDCKRWDQITSYAMAEAYERNGAVVNLGSVFDDGGTVFVHNWTANSSIVLMQNFSGGNFGPSAIIYNPKDGNAYNVRTGFWEYYKNNSGPSLLGPPKEDEHGNSAAQPCAYISCQKFEKGELWWNGTTIVAYVPSIYNIGGSDVLPPSSHPNAPGNLRLQ